MLYEDYETEISKNNLAAVFSKVTKPVCLLGGWAVYFTVNANYKKENGRNYHGSKDIDLGFHFSKNETRESLKRSVFNQSIRALEEIGFCSISFRLVQHYHRETKQALTPEQAKKTQQYDLFDLYVDPIVDNIPENIRDVLGVQPIDEPLLGLIFEKKQFVEIKYSDMLIQIPKPEVLLATKIKSMPARTKDHKKWKDIADIYALIWHSGMKTKELKTGVLDITPENAIYDALSRIGERDYQMAAGILGVAKTEMEDVVKNFTGRPAT